MILGGGPANEAIWRRINQEMDSIYVDRSNAGPIFTKR